MSIFKLVTLAIIISVAGVVVSGCVKKPVTLSNAGGQNANVNQNTNIATTTANIDTSNWKTYRNEKYGFEFKYPEEINGTQYFFVVTDTFHKDRIYGISGIFGANLVLQVALSPQGWQEPMFTFLVSNESTEKVKNNFLASGLVNTNSLDQYKKDFRLANTYVSGYVGFLKNLPYSYYLIFNHREKTVIIETGGFFNVEADGSIDKNVASNSKIIDAIMSTIYINNE